MEMLIALAFCYAPSYTSYIFFRIAVVNIFNEYSLSLA